MYKLIIDYSKTIYYKACGFGLNLGTCNGKHLHKKDEVRISKGEENIEM